MIKQPPFKKKKKKGKNLDNFIFGMGFGKEDSELYYYF